MKMTRGNLRRLIEDVSRDVGVERNEREDHSTHIETEDGPVNLHAQVHGDGVILLHIDGHKLVVTSEQLHEMVEWIEHTVLGQASDADDESGGFEVPSDEDLDDEMYRKFDAVAKDEFELDY